MSTPFVAASSVAIVPVPTLPHGGLDPVNASSSTSFDDEKPEIVNSAAAVEDSRDGLVHGHVLKDGKRVYISWTKEEERRVVRKADFFLLPVLVVSFFLPCLKTGLIDVMRSFYSSGWLSTGATLAES
jgi:hypothetical protein